MGYIGRRVGKTQTSSGKQDDGNGGGILDLFSSGYFQRVGGSLVGATAPGFSITGGQVNKLQPGNGFVYHTFTATGILTATNVPNAGVELLVIGGGGGGAELAGGGGAGGLVYSSSYNLSGTYTVTIGGGGAGTPFGSPPSSNPGTATTFSNGAGILIANGGGGSSNQGIGLTGGSGGGGCGPGAVGPANQPSQNPQFSVIQQYGFAGGSGSGSSPGDRGGGGGGAGAVGNPRTASPTSAYGGNGRQYTQFEGTLIGVPGLAPLSSYFAGGGGGGSRSDTFPLIARPGGLGGGGTGETSVTPGTANSGGGGGGGTYPGIAGGNGGSGIVVLRYPTTYLQ